MNLVILTEEPSMKVTLNSLIPKLGIDISTVTIIAFQGKSDLEKSIPLKLRGWNVPNARFLILRDNDRGNCIARKAHLDRLVQSTGKGHQTKIRIVCQELESWFLADVSALISAGYVKAGSNPSFGKRNPDEIDYPVREMEKISKGYGKGSGAAEIAPHLDPNCERSASFKHTIRAILELTAA